jgi:hypothetical protein
VLNKFTGIGMGVGGVIAAIGFYALVTSFGLQTVPVDDTVETTKSITYQFEAPNHSRQLLNVTGESFHVKITTPADGLKVDNDFKKTVSFDWVMLADGTNKITIQNKGSSQLQIDGAFQRHTDPILYTYHIMVITAGVVIIGFSAGFSARKPKGF